VERTSFSILSATALVLLVTPETDGHVGEKCNVLFRKCLPESPNIYCDQDFICRCDPKYPIVVGPHSCKAPKKIGERCSHTKECNHTDPNSYCAKVPFAPECQCIDGYEFDFTDEKCSRSPKTRKPQASDKVSILTSTVLFLLGCLGVLSVFVFLYQLFCRTPIDNTWHSSPNFQSPNRRVDVRLRPSEDRLTGSRQSYRYSNASSIGVGGLGHLPTYDSATFNQPPPSYEEAIKEPRVLLELLSPSSDPSLLPPPADSIPDVITTSSSEVTPTNVITPTTTTSAPVTSAAITTTTRSS